MHYIKRLALGIPTLALLVSSASVTTVFARGSDDTVVHAESSTTTMSPTSTSSGSGSTSTRSGSDDSTGMPNRPPEGQTGTESENHMAEQTEGPDDSMQKELHSKGQKKVEELKKDHKEKSTEERKNFCNLHRNDFDARFANIKTHATEVQAKISSVYDKSLAFQAANKLTVPGFAALTAKVDADAARTKTDLANLVVPTLDCTSPTVATDVAAFKIAADTVRDDLKTYRSDVKDVIKAIKTAAQATKVESTTTTEGNN